MEQDDAALLESLLTEIVTALTPALRNAEVVLEILRRRRADRSDRSGVVLPDLIDDSRFTVRWKGAECHLGPTVLFRLFRRLARPAGHQVSVEILLEDVWGDERNEGTTVRSAVRNLRRKLEAAGMADLAKAIRGQSSHYCLMLDGLVPRA